MTRHERRRALARRRAARTLVAVVTTSVLTAGVGGAAFAVWSAAGTGSGTATAGTTVALTTSSVTAPTSGAYPGGPAVALSLLVSNPNPVPVRITAVALDGTRPVSVDSGTCPTPPISVSATGLSITVPANAVKFHVSVPSAMTFDTSMASVCQGATFTVPVVLTGQTP